MDGALTVENGSLFAFLDLIGTNLGNETVAGLDRWLNMFRVLARRFGQANPLGLAQRNVAHHYDLSGELFDLFLDRDLQYSCAYFPNPNATLETAQEAKKRHIAAKLLLDPGLTVLDIGSGWGGLAMYLARTSGVDVTGVTLSTNQHRTAQQRAADADLADHVRFHLRDYREETGTYDRIVSIAMFEQVGVPHFREFFQKIAELLTDDGIALIHTISRRDGPDATNPWLRKYIFPGGYSPSLSEILAVIERVGLFVTDIEILRLHYAETLRLWRERFLANWDAAAELYDERFCRMWEFYLAGCEVAFRHQGCMVAQLQLAKSMDAVPLTRDYITDWERAHADESESASLRRIV
jgi:cyclopropane-fatty-acyl-phospholipid synthase